MFIDDELMQCLLDSLSLDFPLLQRCPLLIVQLELVPTRLLHMPQKGGEAKGIQKSQHNLASNPADTLCPRSSAQVEQLKRTIDFSTCEHTDPEIIVSEPFQIGYIVFLAWERTNEPKL